MGHNDTLRVSLPSSADCEAAAVAAKQLKAFADGSTGVYAHLFAGDIGEKEVVEIPSVALPFLVEALEALAAGNSVRVVPIHSELTTQEAANILNVSRPHLVKLLEQGALPFTMTGRHRRVKLADVIEFKAQRDEVSRQAMTDLAAQAQELGLGY